MPQPLVRAWAELYVSTSGMGLGRALCLNFWYGFGPSFIFPFYKKGWVLALRFQYLLIG